MNKRTAAWNYAECDGLDLELFICSEILQLRSLHYGYWQAKQKPTLHNLRKAQQRYTDTLIGLIPPHVRTVLDVGCGIGDVARALVNRGYVVSALSPDRNHEKYFDASSNNLSFIQATFEEFSSDTQYDLILMSESQNYFPTDVGFTQCRRYLKPQGYLLVSGIFRKEAGDTFQDTINVQQEYLQKAMRYGFRIRACVDITRRVLPTLAFAHTAMRKHLTPAAEMVDRYLGSTAPLTTAVLRWVFREQLEHARALFHHYLERTDPTHFEQACRYLRICLQLR